MVESNRDEIAKLEALYAANPEGRVFTHLAEAYRKAGRLEEARQILDEGLTRHADYPSAHVVLGRVLLDAEDRDGAAHAFRRVLELDRHNLIALRALAEAARDAGRSTEALNYYQELSVLDPGNDELGRIVRDLEAAALVAGNEAPIGEAWTRGAIEAAFGDEAPAASDTADSSADEQEPESATLEGLEASYAGEDAVEIEPLDVESPADSAGFADEVPAWAWGEGAEGDVVEVDEPPEPADDEDVTYGLAPDVFKGFTIVPDETEESLLEEMAGSDPAAAGTGDWVPQERWDTFADPAARQTEPQAAQPEWSREPAGEALDEAHLDPDDGLAELEFDEDVADLDLEDDAVLAELEFDDAEVDSAVLEVETVESVRIEVELDPDTANAIVAENLPDLMEVEPAVWSEAAEVVTETMAEVYAAQGLTERAIEVYRQLRQLRPEDDRIEARLADLEQTMAMPADTTAEESAEAREAWIEKVESAWTGGSGAVGAADDTLYGWRPEAEEADAEDARPVGAYFRTLLAWRPQGRASVEDFTAQPDVAAQDVAEPAPVAARADATETAAGDSVEEIAGHAGAEADEELLLVDEIEPVEADDLPAAGGTVEAAFDEWFGPTPDASGAEASPTGTSAEASDGAESDEDLEMFRTWLQSLKK